MDRPELQVTNGQQNAPTLSGYQASVLDLTAALYGTVRSTVDLQCINIFMCMYT